MTEFLIFSLLFSQGLFCFRMLKEQNIFIASSLNHIAGIGLGSIYTTVIIGLNIPFNLYSIAPFFAFVLGVNIIFLRNSLFSRKLLSYLCANIVILFSVTLFTKYFNFTILSFDSYKLVHIANSIAAEGGPTVTIGHSLASWGISLISLHALAPLFSIDYLANLNLILYKSVLFLILGSLYKTALLKNFDKKSVLLMCSLSGLFIVSTYFLSFQAFYIHNALISATLLFAAVYSFLASNDSRGNSTPWYYLSMFFLLVFALARIEAPLIAALTLFFFISHKTSHHGKSLMVLPTFLVILLIILWEIKLISIMGTGSDISNPKRIYILIASLVTVIPVLFLQNNSLVKRAVLKYLNQIIVTTLVVSLLTLVVIKSDHMLTSLENFKTNLFRTGDWAYSWHLLIPLSFFMRYLINQKNPINTLFDISLSMSLVILCLSFMRIPYRIGWGDSANRMMVHVFVILVYYTLASVLQFRIKKPQS